MWQVFASCPVTNAACCCRLSSVVCRSVSWSVTVVSPAKAAESIEMPFVLWTWVGPRNHVLGGVQICPYEGTIWGGDGSTLYSIENSVHIWRRCTVCQIILTTFIDSMILYCIYFGAWCTCFSVITSPNRNLCAWNLEYKWQTMVRTHVRKMGEITPGVPPQGSKMYFVFFCYQWDAAFRPLILHQFRPYGPAWLARGSTVSSGWLVGL